MHKCGLKLHSFDLLSFKMQFYFISVSNHRDHDNTVAFCLGHYNMYERRLAKQILVTVNPFLYVFL